MTGAPNTGAVASGDAAPTGQAYQVYDDIAGKIDAELAKLKDALATDLVAAVLPSATHRPARAAGPERRAGF